MPTIIELPHVGESVTEGVIAKWLKQPGERVEKYEPLVEVMTDKVNMEVPSPHAGTLLRTLVDEGDTVPMGEPICEMDVDGETETPARPEALEGRADASVPHPPARSFEFVDSVRSVGPTGSGEGGRGRPDAALEAAAREAQRLSPLVQRLVRQHGIDVSQVRGTGLSGRVTKDDVLRYVEQHTRPNEAQGVRSEAADGETSVLPLTPLRKAIAEHMARSTREIPAAWSMVEVDATGLVACRDARREAFERAEGARLTYRPFAAHAIAQALLENPRLNARWDGDHVTLHHRVHLGIAVATGDGLIVPVVHDAGQLGVAALAVRIHQLAEAARAQTLKLADVQGGTFTVDNTGALGSVVSVPIINHPQAAIITTEAVVKRPVVAEGDAIVVRSMMNLCLTFDHRVCDGAEAARVLNGVKSRLEAIDERTTLS